MTFVEECVGPAAKKAVAAMKSGDVVLLENLRFHAEETLIDSAKKNPDKKPTAEQRAKIDAFAADLASLADIYCNNAFGTCHRKHASMYDVPMKLGAGPSRVRTPRPARTAIPSVTRFRIPIDRSLRSSAGPKSATKSASLRLCSKRSIPS